VRTHALHHLVRSLILATAATFIGTVLHAQTLNIWPGVAPGSEKWTQKERSIEHTPVGTVLMNIVTPTITAYLPDPSKATGTGIIVAPGGGFVALAITQEGDAARWLQQHGIAAFVLKYRTVEKKFPGIPQMDMDTAGRYGIADGIQALKVVRRHAAQWRIDPHRIGFLGFSAGAMVVSGALLQKDSASRPDFAAFLYGGPFGKMPAIPAKLPPIFMAWASDDDVALAPIVRFHDVLVAAGAAPDTHVYRTGGHGFGMRKQGKPSDRWIDDFYQWMTVRHLAGTTHTLAR
jgi:acetyl esterase/lipase